MLIKSPRGELWLAGLEQISLCRLPPGRNPLAPSSFLLISLLPDELLHLIHSPPTFRQSFFHAEIASYNLQIARDRVNTIFRPALGGHQLRGPLDSLIGYCAPRQGH